MNFVILIVLDGWGIAPDGPGNAISNSRLPYIISLFNNFPNTTLEASGESVGLPRGEDGNTETGHINLGAGYIVPQDLQRINYSIADGTFFQNSAFISAIDHARKYQSNLHLLGLIGSGGVHSNIEHLLALLQLCKEKEFYRVFLHLITDGRDSPPKSAQLYLTQIQNHLNSIKVGQIATLIGRYFAMDRDRRWDRTHKAFKVLTQYPEKASASADEIISLCYKQGITDEFIEPAAVSEKGKVLPRIQDKDSVIFFNYRIDRPRQLTKAFVLKDFESSANQPDFDPYSVKYFKKHEVAFAGYQRPFIRNRYLEHLYFVTMTEYSQSFHVSSVAYPPHIVSKPIGAVIEENGLSQLHASESEKERFVTYYFNGSREIPFANQENLIIPSPAIPTYDLAPEMSANELTESLITRIKENTHHFIIVNFANADMVAHTGNFNPTIKACETLDKCLSLIIPEVLKLNSIAVVTADHGNAEELINQKTGSIDTEHSAYPVPVIFIGNNLKGNKKNLNPGILADVAPTILSLLHLNKPKSMTGRNLLENII